MKKLILGLAALMTAGALSAGSIDYLSNQSADYIRTFSRNASLDADAAVYNPAGTAFLAPGLTFALSNQSVFKLYENDLTLPTAAAAVMGTSYNISYKSTVPTLVLPNAQAIWNGGSWAGYLTTGVTGGGGTAVYDDGVPYMVLSAASKLGTQLVSGSAATTATGATVTNTDITSTSLFPQVTLGGAYALTDAISVSAGLRGVYGYKAFTGKATYAFTTAAAGTITATYEADATQTALGLGGVFGADWKALPGLLVTTRVETPTPLEFETKVNGGKTFNGLFTDGKKERKDLPALAALGVRYDWNALSVTASGTGYFLGLSKKDSYLKNYADFGWESGLSAEYNLLPGQLKLSLGGLVTRVGGNSDTYTDFDFSLDSQSVGGGLVFTPVKDLDLTLGGSNTFYNTAKGQNNTTNYKKNATTLTLGCQYKLF